MGSGTQDLAAIADKLKSESFWDAGGDRGSSGKSLGQTKCAPPAHVSCPPEPAAWMLTIGAIGGVSLMLRRAKTAPRDVLDDAATA